jgi:hypothetical protein
MALSKGDKAKSFHPEYISWKNMKARCYYPKDERYYRYGGRGITVCERWLNDFWDFLADMGKKPGRHYTLDRIDTDGNYEPGNCRWSTVRQQNANRSNSNEVVGVGYIKGTNRWWAQLKINGKFVLRRDCATREEAIAARKKAESDFMIDIIHKHDTMRIKRA